MMSFERQLPKEKEENNEEKITRKVSKVVLRASERNRESLFRKLTAKNAEKIARLLKEKPIFWQNEVEKTDIQLSSDIEDLMPLEFFKNPTKWIESQQNIDRNYGDNLIMPTGEEIEEIFNTPYDISKVKEFVLIDKNGEEIPLVSKRVKKEETEEIARSIEAQNKGIPTPKILGEILDKGNIYIFFKKIEGIDLLSAYNKKKIEDIFYENILDFAATKEDFLDILNSFKCREFISEEAIKKIAKIWEKAKDEFIIEKKINLYLQSFINNLINGHGINSEYQNFEENDLKKILIKYGYKDISHFIDEAKKDIDSMFLDEIEEKYRKLYKKLKERDKEMVKLSIKFRNKINSIIFEDIFGIDIPKKVEEIEKMCKKKDIKHKDLSDRNILIEWDFEKEKPKIKKKEVKLYLIDWEEK